jgi:hypothetical protein
MSIAPRPTTKDELLYQTAPGFVSRITIGGDAPDGPAHTLDGASSTLHGLIDTDRLTVLNFGSCT